VGLAGRSLCELLARASWGEAQGLKERKIVMSIPKTYDKNREAEIYARWQSAGYFRANAESAKTPYTIMIPPPNITDKLHMGHALNNTVQDILIRFKRMQGFEALWLPGTDHAAISTEVVVMRALAKEGITKESLGREGFLEKLWEWNEIYGGKIISQLKTLGSSCDWSRQRFTMDEGLSDAVLEAFVQLYNEGKIYRGERLINWCVKCGTTISDAEVEHEDTEGCLYHFKYPIVGGDDFIAFATTRPETMLGDTAIAVNPSDDRYAALVGKFALVPMVNREIPIIADSYVDPEYGTGVVKITPAHDPNDFEVGIRHNLPRINIMHDDGKINDNGAAYSGLSREEARVKIIEEMTERGLYIKTEKITHAVGAHDRCGTIVEPLLKLQWFVEMGELAKPAMEAFTSGRLKFNRERFGKIYMHWLENIRDWCISRQLWWGHRVPAYYCKNGHITVAKTAPDVCAECGAGDLKQDPDVLDTWFSSALWPFSTLGWPHKTPELDKFYPTNVLATAQDIIFFWVVRMVFMGEKFMGKAPFTNVIIHGIVRDENGVKMSKSLGNGIDPLEIVEQFGADVLRLMLISGTTLDSDMRFHRSRLEPARNFLNKLWNATRFVLMNIEGAAGASGVCGAGLNGGNFNTGTGQSSTCELTNVAAHRAAVEDRWILSRLAQTVAEVTEKLDAHELGLAAQKITDFIWDEFCDWYVEMVKPRLYAKEVAGDAGATSAANADAGNGTSGADNRTSIAQSRAEAQATLCKVLTTAVKLLHPFAPFITEDLFLALGGGETVMLAEWPNNVATRDAAAEKAIDRVKEAVRGIRAVRTEKQVPPSQKITVVVVPTDDEARELFTSCRASMALLAGAKEVEIKEAAPENAVSVVVLGATLYLPLDSLVDAEKERARLAKEKEKLQQEIARIDVKLSNEGFLAKAPQALVDAERAKRIEFAEKLAKINTI